VFSLAYASVCAYAYACAYAPVKTSLKNRARPMAARLKKKNKPREPRVH